MYQPCTVYVSTVTIINYCELCYASHSMLFYSATVYLLWPHTHILHFLYTYFLYNVYKINAIGQLSLYSPLHEFLIPLLL